MSPAQGSEGIAQVGDGIEVYYRVTGSGEPLVLISGTSMDHQMWDLQLAAYAEHFTVITFDNRGAGRSSAPPLPRGYSPARMSGDVAGLLDHLGVERAHVAGVSLGSAIAQELALAHPERTATLQLHSTWGRSDEWLRRALVGTVRYAMQHADRRTALRTSLMWIMSPSYLEHREPAEVRDLVSRIIIKNPNLPSDDGFVGQLRADAVHDALDRLSEITAPTLVTIGELDVCLPPRYGQAVAAAIPGARTAWFEGEHASHCAMWEMAEEFNRVTLEFLLEHAGTGSRG